MADASTTGYLLNRYLAFCRFTKFEEKFSYKKVGNRAIRYQKVQYQKKFYVIQFRNIKSDLLGLFKNPLPLLPKIAYSLAAFYFILLGRHQEAINTAFFIGAIAHDTISSGQNDGASSITIAHTTGAGSDRLMVFKSHVEANATPANRPVTGVTYNSIAGTKADDELFTSPGGEDDGLEIYYLVAPATGANNAVITWTGAVEGSVAAIETYTGVDQSTPLDAIASTSTTSTGPMEVVITTTVDDCLIVGAVQTISSSRVIGANSGQTQTYNIQNAGQLKAAGGYEIVGAAGAYTESWTTDANSDWLIGAAAFRPSVAAPATAVQDPVGGDIVPFER
jgi:hypothetical protein